VDHSVGFSRDRHRAPTRAIAAENCSKKFLQV
jgi:hypothetical protein